MTFLPGFEFTAFVGVFTFADAAHNEYAQFLAETGLVGAILMALILIAVLWRAVTRPVLTASDVVALCIVAIALVSASLNFPIQKPATSALAFAALGILARKNDTVLGAQHVNILPGKVHRARLWAFIAFLLLWSGVSYGYVRAAVAAGIFVREFQAHIAIDQKAAYQGVIAAHGWFPLHPVYRLQLFPTLVGLIESDRNAAVTFAEADRAYAISRSAGANEPVLTLARARYLALTGRGGPAEIYALFDRARHNASALPLTHILETRYALSIGDLSRAEIALARARVGAHAVARHFGSSPDQPAIDILSREIEVRMQQLPRPAGRITD